MDGIKQVRNILSATTKIGHALYCAIKGARAGAGVSILLVLQRILLFSLMYVRHSTYCQGSITCGITQAPVHLGLFGDTQEVNGATALRTVSFFICVNAYCFLITQNSWWRGAKPLFPLRMRESVNLCCEENFPSCKQPTNSGTVG